MGLSIGIQRTLEAMPYHVASSAWSPRRVLREGTAHCLEGAICAAAALRVLPRDLWWVAEHLVAVPHHRVLTAPMARRLSRVDRRSLAAGLVGYRKHRELQGDGRGGRRAAPDDRPGPTCDLICR